MINNALVKNLVVNNFVKDTDMTNYERCAVECISYQYTMALLNTGSSNDASSVISLYADKLKSAFMNASGVYVSYMNIINYLINYNLVNLLAMTDDQINKVYTMYSDTVELVAFDVSTFDPLMYGVENSTPDQASYLKKVHFNVITRIIKYYHDIYGAEYSSMKVENDASSIANPGKVLNFYIDGIDSSRVYSDIIKKTIYINYYKLTCIYPKIQIITI